MAITIDGTDGFTSDNAALKFDTDTIVVDDTNNNVGIGTATPDGKLSVEGSYIRQNNEGSSYGLLRLGNSLDHYIIGYNSDHASSPNSLAFKSNNTESYIWFSVGSEVPVVIESNGDLRFNSGYGSAATAYGCRAWVNFNGTGTVAIRGSGNVSSITDNGTGQYTANLTTAMPDVNYAFTGTATSNLTLGVSNWNASIVIFNLRNNASTLSDSSMVNIAIFR
jgi:hypothetical protein